MGVENISGISHSSGDAHVRRRAVFAGDAEQSGGARPVRGSQSGVGEGERNHKSGRRIRGSHGRKQGGASRTTPIQKPLQEEEPAAAGDRSARDSGVPAAHRNELHSFLRPGNLPKPRLRLRRVTLLLHHHQRSAGGGRRNIHGVGRQVRAEILLPGSRS